MGVSGRAMIEALIAGEHDPHVLAALAKGRLRVKHVALVEALTGRFDDHHGELARILLDQIDALSAQITTLTARIDEAISAIPAAQAPDLGTGSDGAPPDPATVPLSAVARLDESPASGCVPPR